VTTTWDGVFGLTTGAGLGAALREPSLVCRLEIWVAVDIIRFT